MTGWCLGARGQALARGLTRDRLEVPQSPDGVGVTRSRSMRKLCVTETTDVDDLDLVVVP